MMIQFPLFVSSLPHCQAEFNISKRAHRIAGKTVMGNLLTSLLISAMTEF